MVLIINSPHEFYKILKDNKDLLKLSNDIIRFDDHMTLHMNGCNCDKSDQLSKALRIYKSLNRMDVNAISELKLSIKCDRIIFNLSGVFIFEI